MSIDLREDRIESEKVMIIAQRETPPWQEMERFRGLLKLRASFANPVPHCQCMIRREVITVLSG